MGKAAGEHCNDFGWAPVGAVDASLVAEVEQAPRHGLGRAWSATSTYALTRAPERIYLVYTVEGGFDFTVDGHSESTGAGQLVLLDGDAPTTAKTRAGTARFVWHLTPTFLDPNRSRFRFHEPVAASNAPMRALMSMTNAILNAPSRARMTAASNGHVGLALEHVVAAVLDESGTRPESSAGIHRDGLFTMAQWAIESYFRDPGFGVARLARELSTGETALRAAFAAFGTTPRREIERRRMSEVERLSGQIMTQAQVVELSGFGSLRQYRQALARSSHVQRESASS